MDKNFHINIGRQLGSGGHQIGEMLARNLEVPFYDKELIDIASQKSGLRKELFERADEKTTHSLFGGLFGFRSSFDEIYISSYLCNETLFGIQSDTILELAEQGPCIFVGRCADYVLRDNKNCINVFINADMEDRIRRIAKIQKMPADKTRELIEKIDKKRAEYYNYYCRKNWGAAESYHLCINSSVLGIEGTVNFLSNFAEKFKTQHQIADDSTFRDR